MGAPVDGFRVSRAPSAGVMGQDMLGLHMGYAFGEDEGFEENVARVARKVIHGGGDLDMTSMTL
ncbi:hypothetical protein HO173_003516 [Letharia columbiana]|uniref:Uncharacterized protein n=1 Tax=Letharia columbiana TaxID=112416 RepID=A0A8H6L776_9LECA|nr:uncharacterized protein HO173_003516 [Letharia columbiana]KAF6238236.1 hypothetical protein HO173_003516 [Letharia columbiana]